MRLTRPAFRFLRRCWVSVRLALPAMILASPVGAQPIQNLANGHYYEYVDAFNIGWEDARMAAEARNFAGASGYLATITSAQEDAFLEAHFSQFTNVWIGASDDAQEGLWEWVTGPEAGTPFWSGGPKGMGGAPIAGAYENWRVGEPNNQLSREDHALWNGENSPGIEWNDHLRGPNPDPIFDIIGGYMVEYSGLPAPQPETRVIPLMSTRGQIVFVLLLCAAAWFILARR